MRALAREWNQTSERSWSQQHRMIGLRCCGFGMKTVQLPRDEPDRLLCSRRKEIRYIMFQKRKHNSKSTKMRMVVSHFVLPIPTWKWSRSLEHQNSVPRYRSQHAIWCPFQQLKRIHAFNEGNNMQPPAPEIGIWQDIELSDIMLAPLGVTLPIRLNGTVIIQCF